MNYDLKKDVLDVDGSLMKFDFFLEFQKQAYMWNRILFAPTKKQLLAERRTLMATGADPARYRVLCIQVQTQDEMCLQGVLNKMLDKISMTDEDFQKSLLRHMQDPGKVAKVKELQQANEEGRIETEDPDILFLLEQVKNPASVEFCSNLNKKEAIDF